MSELRNMMLNGTFKALTKFREEEELCYEILWHTMTISFGSLNSFLIVDVRFEVSRLLSVTKVTFITIKNLLYTSADIIR